MTRPLTPEPVAAVATNKGRFPFAFGPRFFLALAIGIIWLVPVWWSLRWVPLVLLWNVLVIAAWFWDSRRLPAPATLKLSRAFTGPLILGRPVNVVIGLRHAGTTPLHVSAIDELSPALYGEVPQLQFAVAPDGEARHEYTIVPRKRGDMTLGSVFLTCRTGFGFAERWMVAPLTQTICVLPDIREANQQALFLIRSRQVDIQRRRHRDPGLGREFESLREYRQGDDVRDVSWPATARRHHLVTRTFQAERSQTVWIVMDAGRLMRAEIEKPGQEYRLSKLDYSVDAALSIARVALQYGDRVAGLAYGRKIQHAIGSRSGPAHIRTWVEALARVRPEMLEGNHGLAARVLMQKQTRRALVIWLTDFPETPTVPDVIEYAGQLAKRHLVLFAAVSQPDLAVAAHRVPETEHELYRTAAALGLLQRREILIRSLKQQGVLALEITPGNLSTRLVNEYLLIKDRNLI